MSKLIQEARQFLKGDYGRNFNIPTWADFDNAMRLIQRLIESTETTTFKREWEYMIDTVNAHSEHLVSLINERASNGWKIKSVIKDEGALMIFYERHTQ